MVSGYAACFVVSSIVCMVSSELSLHFLFYCALFVCYLGTCVVRLPFGVCVVRFLYGASVLESIKFLFLFWVYVLNMFVRYVFVVFCLDFMRV